MTISYSAMLVGVNWGMSVSLVNPSGVKVNSGVGVSVGVGLKSGVGLCNGSGVLVGKRNLAMDNDVIGEVRSGLNGCDHLDEPPFE